MTGEQYRGRIAPSPTGFLHIGHAVTFWHAQERARAAGGKLILRIEDLDRDRCRREFADAMIEDLHWFGLNWDEGADIGGPFIPYVQSQRRSRYLEAWEELRVGGFIYPCKCSRKDVAEASLAPHDENEEPIYPGTCRPQHFSVEAAVSAATGNNLQATRLPPQRRGNILPPVTAGATGTTETPAGMIGAFVCPTASGSSLSMSALEGNRPCPGATSAISLFGDATMSRPISWPWWWMMPRCESARWCGVKIYSSPLSGSCSFIARST